MVSVCSLKMEIEKLAQEKTEMQRHYVMVSWSHCFFVSPLHELASFAWHLPINISLIYVLFISHNKLPLKLFFTALNYSNDF